MKRPTWLAVWIVSIVWLLTSVDAFAQTEGDTLARVKASGVLRWGGDVQGGEPYVFEDPNNPKKLIGFEVDLVRAIARELGVRDEFVQNEWANLVPSLERGTFDVVLNGLEVTPARDARVLFTRPYYIFRMRLMARASDTSITGLASLKGRRVGTLANSMSWELLRSSDVEAVPYDGTEEPYLDLESERTDGVLLDDIISDRYGVPRPTLRVVGDVGEGYYAIAVRRSDVALANALNTALDHIAESGELRSILGRWNIDGDPQARLVHWKAGTSTKASVALRPPPAKLTREQVWLFFKAAWITLRVSVASMAIAIPLGLLLALARMYAPRVVQWITGAYIELFRGTPVLLQLYVIYYGLPQVSRVLHLGKALDLSPMTAAIVGLGLNYAAYEAEVYRAGIQAVPKGQMEAAVSLGMSTPLALRRVVIPQAFRLALPSVTNDFIALLKDSSLVSAITVVDLTKRMTIAAVDLRSWLVPGALCALLYFAMSYPLSLVARRLEHKMGRG